MSQILPVGYSLPIPAIENENIITESQNHKVVFVNLTNFEKFIQ